MTDNDAEQTELEKMNVRRPAGIESNRITRECLHMALIELLSEKDLQYISITELVRKAGVSRATFYRNYSSKDELAAEILDRMVKEVEPFFRAASSEEAYRCYLDFFRKAKDNRRVAMNVLKSQTPLGTALSAPSVVEFDQRGADMEERYRILAFDGAFFNIVRVWIASGMEESPEEMAALCVRMLKFS